MKALVTGAAGQLGGAMAARLADRYDVVALTRRELDLTDGASIFRTVVDLRPSVILNCAAYNLVDQAEREPQLALQVNSFAPRALAEAAEQVGATLVHYGTDFVFEGTASRPYEETDPTGPQSVYAVSKLLGDWFAARTPAHYVLRVESLFGGATGGKSIAKIVAAIEQGEETPVFIDRVVTPSYVEDVVSATLHLVEARAPFGLYHCVNSGETTWERLAEYVAQRLHREARLRRVRVDEVQLPAKRPKYCALSNRKLAAAGFRMPSWQEALDRYLSVMETRSA
jgi:dTDP-4-dehydrorhamnose reductase